LSTLLGGRKRGFFIPYRHADAVAPRAYPALVPWFRAAESRMATVLDDIDIHADDLGVIARGRGPARFDQDWFPALDAAAAYAIVRRFKPARIVEIGSGHSTRFMARAVKEGGLATDILCIDPAPRAGIEALGVRHMARLLGEEDGSDLAALAPGDILFIDSSHVAMPGTDVDRLMLDVLPRLRAGVVVHVHDVFLPDAYPATWEWRGYNEQSLVGALLQGGGYEILFASHWARMHLVAGRERHLFLHVPPGAHETSLWLVKSG
jgi:predicted O-methyltransferase YrrM